MNETLKNKGRTRIRLLAIAAAVFALSVTASAQNNTGRVSLGLGLLYENGLDATVAYEWETKHLKWDECPTCRHVCPESFWRNYRSYGAGVAYKPCVVRGRNHFGNLRIGASAGSDTDRFLGGIHIGYEHNYALRSGWMLYWQVKGDLMIKGEDLLRTGVVLGFKIPCR